MLSAINRLLRRQRRRLILCAAVLAVSGLVVAAHSVVAGEHMSDGMTACLAIAEGTALVGASAMTLRCLAARRFPLSAGEAVSSGHLTSRPRGPHSRAGPPVIQVFRL